MNKTANTMDEVYRDLNIGNLDDKREIETLSSQLREVKIDTPVNAEMNNKIVWFLTAVILSLTFLIGFMMGKYFG